MQQVFIITSTINTSAGLIPVADRYQQTLDTISSIRDRVPGVMIVMIDNSSLALAQEIKHELESRTDYFLDIGQRRFCQDINGLTIKGAGECYMLLVALDLMSRELASVHRIFKISGRYRLTQDFDINRYLDLTGRYCFKTRETNAYGREFLHTRLWSACGSLRDHMQSLVADCLQSVLRQHITVEEAMFNHMDTNILAEFHTIHCEGHIAPWNQLIRD